ncbi:MAG: DUF4919 domain-containing protein [Bacteroidales bacterium]|nr:DUF4919 domain-containing protein [Bacteroidales bacterium]
MSRTIFFFLLSCITLEIYAQENASIDFHSKIKSAVTDSTSQYFYPNLLEKIKTNPADITEEDCFYLYYGEVFQTHYKRIDGGLSFVRNPERADFDRAAMNGNCKKVIELGKVMLDRNSVDLTVLLHTSICIDKQKKYVDNEYISQRFRNLLSAIFSTGDGRTKETAIKIVSPEDDYVIKGALGFFGGKERHMFDDSGAYTIAYSIWEKDGVKLYFEDVINPEW